MKNTTKRVRLDKTKLLGFRKLESLPTDADEKTLKRLHHAMAGVKPGIKTTSR